jgi:putative transposase
MSQNWNFQIASGQIQFSSTAPFRNMKALQKFSSVHAQVHNHFNQERHLVTRHIYKQRRTAALAESRALAA